MRLQPQATRSSKVVAGVADASFPKTPDVIVSSVTSSTLANAVSVAWRRP